MKLYRIFSFAILIVSLNSVISCQTGTENKTPVQYRLRQIMMEPQISSDTEAKVLKKAEDCLKRAKAGEDFTTLAKTLSEEPNAENSGGDLGFFLYENMVEPFSKAVFAMKPGEISGPVKTQFGYHIIKLIEIKGDKRHAKHILFNLTPTKDDSLKTMATLESVRKRLAGGESFDKLLKQYNKYDLLRETNGFMVWQKPDEMIDSFANALTGLKKGDITQPFQSILGFHILLVDSINYDPDHLLSGLPQISK